MTKLRIANHSRTFRKIARSLGLVAVPMCVLIGCGGGADGGGTVGGGGGGGGGFIPDISNTFQGFDSAGRRIDLQMFATDNPTGKGQAAGTLDGTRSELAIFDASGNSPPNTKVSGSYTGSAISITLAAAVLPLAQSYTGTFIDPDTIVFQPSTVGATGLTLRRTGFFSADVVDNWNGTTSDGKAWLVQLGIAEGYDASPSAHVEGAELLNGRISRVTGYVNVRAMHLVVERVGGTVTLDGEFPVAGGTTDPNTMKFGTATLARGGTADPQKVAFLAQPTTHTELHVSDAKGNAPALLAPPPADVADVEDFAVSPDRTKIVSMAAGVVGANVYVTDVATKQTTPVVLSAAAIVAVQGGSFVWSPDSGYVAFLAMKLESDVTNSDAPNIYVLRISDLHLTQVSNAKTVNASFNFTRYEWAPVTSGTQSLACAISETSNADRTELFLYRPESTPVRTRIIALSPDLDVTEMEWSGDRTRLAFVVGGRLANASELFVSTATQGNFPADTYVPISMVPSTGLVSDVEWSGNSQFAAFFVTPPAGARELHTVAAGSAQSTVVSHAPGATAAPDVESYSWAPDSMHLAFNAITPGAATRHDLYAVSPMGAPAPAVMSSAPLFVWNDGAKPSWSPNSQKLVYEARVSANTYNVVTVGVDGTQTHVFAAAGSTDCIPAQATWLPAVWSPDGAKVASVVSSGDQLGDCTLNIALADGSGAHSLLLNNRDIYIATISEYSWLPDGARVVFIQSTYRDAFQRGELRLGSAGDEASLRLFGKLGENVPTSAMAPL